MTCTHEQYHEYVRGRIERIIEVLARVSFGDFSSCIDAEELEKNDEFAEVFWGLELMIDDLAEARREIDRENTFNELRAEIWKIGTKEHATVEEFIQILLDTVGPRMNVDRALYLEIDRLDKDAVCTYEWKREEIPTTLGLALPPAIWHHIVGEQYVAFNELELPDRIREESLALMARYDCAAGLAVPFGSAKIPDGIFAFGDRRENREWSNIEKKILWETVTIVMALTARISAEKALREMNVELEKQVKTRTEELAMKNRELREDIRIRHEMERALRESEKTYRGMIETCADAILVTDLSGGLILVNNAAEALFGASGRRELLDNSCLSLVCEKDREAARNVWLTPDTMVPVHVQEFTFVRIDGSSFLGESRSSVIRDADGNMKGQLIFIYDITRKRRQEEELFRARKLESIGALAGGIAHDFNNMLTGIISTLDIVLSDSGIVPQTRRMLREARDAAFRAGGLTKQLLTFSKGGAPIKEPVPLRNIIEESVSFCLSGSMVDAKLNFPDNLPAAEADKGQLDQVMNNLLINAVQAMPDGGRVIVNTEIVVMHIKNEFCLKPGRYIRVAVKDHGNGIAPEYHERLFDPYFTTKPDGHGLGLTTAYSIIEKHGGFLHCEETSSRGTTFAFFIPAAQIVPENKPVTQKEFAGGSGRVLVMDDDPMVRKVIEKLLASAGYHVDCAINGAEALEKYVNAKNKGEPFDVVIMDLTIKGGGGGKETIGRLLGIDPDAKAIVASGYSNDSVMANFRDYGFKGMLTKPFDINTLIRVVNTVAGNMDE